MSSVNDLPIEVPFNELPLAQDLSAVNATLPTQPQSISELRAAAMAELGSILTRSGTNPSPEDLARSAALNAFLDSSDRFATQQPATTNTKSSAASEPAPTVRPERLIIRKTLLEGSGKRVGEAHPALLFTIWDPICFSLGISDREFRDTFPLLLTESLVPLLATVDRSEWKMEDHYNWAITNAATPADKTALFSELSAARQRPNESVTDFILRFECLDDAAQRIGGACPDMAATILPRLRDSTVAARAKDIKANWDATFVPTTWSRTPAPGNLRATLIQLDRDEAQAPPEWHPAKRPKLQASDPALPTFHAFERAPRLAPGRGVDDGCFYHHERRGSTTHTNGDCLDPHHPLKRDWQQPHQQQRDLRPSGSNATLGPARGPVVLEAERKANGS